MRLVDHGGVDLLDVADCRRLLGGCEVGRLGLVDGGQPVIFPVNYAVVGDTVVFRTAEGTKLTHANGARACFEIDEIDAATHSGWSVLAVGRLEELGPYEDDEAAHLRALPLSPWASGDRSHWMRLVTTRVSGRRVGGIDG
jgi:nitroimidazol reductase NimA-like FMN-containing flavoprotein (pyridoxamine 5'-phosphate oxidase superfamily)